MHYYSIQLIDILFTIFYFINLLSITHFFIYYVDNNRYIMSTPVVGDERNEHVPLTTNQPNGDKNTNQEEEENVIKKKRKKTSSMWNDFEEVEIVGAGKNTICKYCKVRLSTTEPGGSTSNLRRHSDKCNERRSHVAKEKNQFVIPFKPSNPSNAFLIPGVKYSNERMREIIATAVGS